MVYMSDTKKKVEVFLARKKVVLQTNVQYLGSKTMKIKHPTIVEILEDLQKEKKIKIMKFNVGGNTFTQIEWIETKVKK
jgi:hypothetical protein